MHRLDTLERVTLPNGRTFLARCKHVARLQLLANVVLARPYKQRAAPKGRRRRQCVRGLFSFVKKLAKNSTVRSLAKQGIKHLPGLYNAMTKTIKNDKLRSALQSDTVQGIVN